MLKLNIIPQELKDEIKYRSVLLSLKNLFYIITTLFIIYATVLLLAKLILQIQFVKTVEETTFVTKNTENYNMNVRDINKQMTSATKIIDDSVLWSGLLERISEITPDGLKFSQLKFDKELKTVFLQGNAITREKLLEFKAEFEKSGLFGEINFPTKNLLEKNNINFEISAKIISYDF